jgi:hypothetical protein
VLFLFLRAKTFEIQQFTGRMKKEKRLGIGSSEPLDY